MDESANNDEVVTVLLDRPEVAQWLGHYVAQYAVFEFALLGLYSTVLSKTPQETLEYLGTINSFRGRLDRVEEHLPRANIDEELRKRIAEHIPEIRARNDFRNSVVHGMYFVNSKTKKLRVRAFMTNSRKEDIFVDLDENSDIMAQEIEMIRLLINFVSRADLLEAPGVPKDLKKAVVEFGGPRRRES